MLSRFLAWKAKKRPWINRYTIVIFLFVIWMSVFDRHDIFTHIFLHQKVKELQEEKRMYEKGIEETQVLKDRINNDVEKFAREKYYMHRPDEEVFIIRTSD